MATEQRWKWGIFIAVVAIVGWLYWRNYQQNQGQPGTSSMNQAIAQDESYYQAWQDAQSQQPSGQAATPAPAGNQVVYGSPVGFGAGTSVTPSASMSLPVNL
ncbi:MAG TPA: hypothetical protein VFK47_13010 [Ktedonobacteraceae bacterium]|nr:hypothetical protein [Ktedonobacteraceae bacterium]